MDRPKRSEKRATCEGQEGGYIRKETDDIADAHATVKRWEENVEGPCPSDSLNEDEVMSHTAENEESSSLYLEEDVDMGGQVNDDNAQPSDTVDLEDNAVSPDESSNLEEK